MGLTFKFDKSKESNEARQGNAPLESEEKDIELYNAPGNVRNVCFIQPDGRKLFLNYAYLVSGEFIPNENTIILTFTTHAVTIKGQNLQEVYDGILTYKIKSIKCVELRYAEIEKEGHISVTEIIISTFK